MPKNLTPGKQPMPDDTRSILLDCMRAYDEPLKPTFQALRDRWPDLDPVVRFRIASKARYLSFRWEQDDIPGDWEAKDALVREISAAVDDIKA